MQSLKSSLVIVFSMGLLFLGACGGSQASNSGSQAPDAAATPETASPADSAASPMSSMQHANMNDSASSMSSMEHANMNDNKAQVVESGSYQVKLVTLNKEDGTHVDFFLSKADSQEPVLTASGNAQFQLPDGTQKTIDLTYDAAGKHYYTTLPKDSTGEHKVAVMFDINGEKVNGQFTFMAAAK